MKKEKMKFIITSINIFWILVLFFLTGILIWQFGQYLIWAGVLIIFAVMHIIWWLKTMDNNEEMDIFAKLICVLSLNFVSLVLTNSYFYNFADIKTNDEKMTKKAKSSKIKREDFMPKWEKELEESKKAKKTNNNSNSNVESEEGDLSLERIAIRNFIKFVMFKVFQENPGITNTFEITKLIKTKVFNESERKDLIADYTKEIKLWNNSDLGAGYDYQNLLLINPDEFMVAHNQDRIEITIEVKKMLKKNGTQ